MFRVGSRIDRSSYGGSQDEPDREACHDTDHHSLRTILRPWTGTGARQARPLDDAEWLDGTFSAGDLMMVMVLRRADRPLPDGFPALAAYVAHAEARPAFRRAHDAQRAVFLAASDG